MLTRGSWRRSLGRRVRKVGVRGADVGGGATASMRYRALARTAIVVLGFAAFVACRPSQPPVAAPAPAPLLPGAPEGVPVVHASVGSLFERAQVRVDGQPVIGLKKLSSFEYPNWLVQPLIDRLQPIHDRRRELHLNHPRLDRRELQKLPAAAAPVLPWAQAAEAIAVYDENVPVHMAQLVRASMRYAGDLDFSAFVEFVRRKDGSLQRLTWQMDLTFNTVHPGLTGGCCFDIDVESVLECGLRDDSPRYVHRSQRYIVRAAVSGPDHPPRGEGVSADLADLAAMNARLQRSDFCRPLQDSVRVVVRTVLRADGRLILGKGVLPMHLDKLPALRPPSEECVGTPWDRQCLAGVRVNRLAFDWPGADRWLEREVAHLAQAGVPGLRVVIVTDVAPTMGDVADAVSLLSASASVGRGQGWPHCAAYSSGGIPPKRRVGSGHAATRPAPQSARVTPAPASSTQPSEPPSRPSSRGCRSGPCAAFPLTRGSRPPPWLTPAASTTPRGRARSCRTRPPPRRRCQSGPIGSAVGGWPGAAAAPGVRCRPCRWPSGSAR